jgi:hypothetical protein
VPAANSASTDTSSGWGGLFYGLLLGLLGYAAYLNRAEIIATVSRLAAQLRDKK